MRVLVVDPDPARAALVVAGLGDIDPLQVRSVLAFEEGRSDLAEFKPDVIVIACDSPDRDTL